MAIGSPKVIRKKEGYHFGKPTKAEQMARKSVLSRAVRDAVQAQTGTSRSTIDRLFDSGRENVIKVKFPNVRNYGVRERAQKNSFNRTPMQQRIERLTGVPNSWDTNERYKTSADVRAERMASAVDAFMSHQPRGGVITNSSHG